MTIGERLKQARLEEGYMQKAAAAKAGICGRRLTRYENGYCNPSVITVMKLAKVYHMSVNTLLKGVDID